MKKYHELKFELEINERKRLHALREEIKLGAIRVDTKNPREVVKMYNYAIKKTGMTAQSVLYSKPIYYGYQRKHNPTRKEDRKMANEQNVKRARTKVYDLVNTNYTKYTKMITITYAETLLDYDRLYLDFKHFIQALKRKGYTFPYLSITENQRKRGKKEGNEGSLHLHVLVFSDVYIPFKILKETWKKGSIHIERIGRAKDKGAYVAKYITKETMPADKKSYRTSRNIKKPTVKVGFGTEYDIVSEINKTYSFKDDYNYRVIRGHNQVTGEINEQNDAKVTNYVQRSERKVRE